MNILTRRWMDMKVLSASARQMVLVLVATGVAGCIVTPARDRGVWLAPTVDQVNDRAVDQVNDRASERARVLILAEIRSYYRDLSARDWDAFAQHFWRGATVTTIWEPDGEGRRVVFNSVPEFIAEVDPGPDSGTVFDEQLGAAEVHVSGNLAVVWAEYRVRFGDSSSTVREWTGIDAFTLMKHVGIWKITSIAFAPE